MKRLFSLSIVFPAFNDSQSLPGLLTTVTKTASKITNDFEIIVVNDGSTDETQETLKKIKKTNKRLFIINHGENRGYGAAITTGLKKAKKEWVFYTDGDGQYDPQELVLLVDKLSADIDVVNGRKRKRKDSVIRMLVGNIYNWFLHAAYPVPISDVDCDFRLIKRQMLLPLELHFSSGVFCLELILLLQKKGARFAEVAVHHYKRPYGSSQFFRWRHIVSMLKDHFVLFFRSSKLH